jgi:hypothetical protein
MSQILDIINELDKSKDGDWLTMFPEHMNIRKWLIKNALIIEADPKKLYRTVIILIFPIYRGVVHGDDEKFNTIDIFGKSSINRILGGGITTLDQYLKIIAGFDFPLMDEKYFENYILTGST